ncbi:MAG: hypothetical protein OXH16_18200 [Gemmatimonadetes bacterium]|nr:hypothetical protein [Gemmatimonadota bacterium]
MQEKLLNRLEQVENLGKAVLATTKSSEYGGRYVDTGKANGFKAASLSFIERVYGKDHSYYDSFNTSVDGYYPSDIESGLEILNSIKQEIEGDWLFTVKGLVAAELFADFLEMADHLLTQEYKDPAAVIIGSVLEEHLRQLCNANSVSIEFENNQGILIPKKADRLNSDLAKENVYSKLDQKAVTMWLDLRNKAAHGKYDEYTSEQVTNMYSGITEFMARLSISV